MTCPTELQVVGTFPVPFTEFLGESRSRGRHTECACYFCRTRLRCPPYRCAGPIGIAPRSVYVPVEPAKSAVSPGQHTRATRRSPTDQASRHVPLWLGKPISVIGGHTNHASDNGVLGVARSGSLPSAGRVRERGESTRRSSPSPALPAEGRESESRAIMFSMTTNERRHPATSGRPFRAGDSVTTGTQGGAPVGRWPWADLRLPRGGGNPEQRNFKKRERGRTSLDSRLLSLCGFWIIAGNPWPYGTRLAKSIPLSRSEVRGCLTRSRKRKKPLRRGFEG